MSVRLFKKLVKYPGLYLKNWGGGGGGYAEAKTLYLAANKVTIP